MLNTLKATLLPWLVIREQRAEIRELRTTLGSVHISNASLGREICQVTAELSALKADIERRRLASIDMGFAVERLEKQLAKKAA